MTIKSDQLKRNQLISEAAHHLPEQFEVRAFKGDDQHEAVTLYISVFSSPPWNDVLVEEEITLFFQRLQALNTFRGFVLVDLQTEKIVGVSLGFIRPWYGGEQYHLDSLYIDVGYQNQKLGSCFLTAIKEFLQDSGVPAIFLDTEKESDAEFFYKKNGFTPLTESVNYVYLLDKPFGE